MSEVNIEPFHFGSPDKLLYGCYHVPRTSLARTVGVVLCYPVGQEYIRSHRSYRQLAIRLCNAGFPVLRFDYFGCGDSGGDCTEAEVRQWLRDVSMAVDECKRRSGLDKVCLVGLRLGGALSMIVGAQRRDITLIVLWSPVISGHAYTEELGRLQKKMLAHAYVDARNSLRNEEGAEILGFMFPSHLLGEVGGIDLLTVNKKPANRMLLIQSSKEDGGQLIAEHLRALGVQVEHRGMPDPSVWLEEPNKGIVPHNTLQAVVSWISTECP